MVPKGTVEWRMTSVLFDSLSHRLKAHILLFVDISGPLRHLRLMASKSSFFRPVRTISMTFKILHSGNTNPLTRGACGFLETDLESVNRMIIARERSLHQHQNCGHTPG